MLKLQKGEQIRKMKCQNTEVRKNSSEQARTHKQSNANDVIWDADVGLRINATWL